MGYYDTAQVCLNGHIITANYNNNPSIRQDYCGQCGEKTVISCQNCGANIHGDYIIDGFWDASDPKVDDYCYKCGQPYPWTQEKLDATQELLELEGTLTSEELSYLADNMNSILVNTPKTKVVATKLKIAISKTSDVVSSALRDILVDIASEAAKKILFPGA